MGQVANMILHRFCSGYENLVFIHVMLLAAGSRQFLPPPAPKFPSGHSPTRLFPRGYFPPLKDMPRIPLKFYGRVRGGIRKIKF